MAEKRHSKLFVSSIESTLDLLADALKDLDGNKPRVAFVSGREHMRRIAQQQSGDITTPYIAAQVENISLFREGYNQKMLNKHGINGGYVDEQGTRIYKWYLKPIETSVGILLITQDYEQMMALCEKWFIHTSKIHFDLDSKDGTSFSMKVSLNKELQVPEVQLDENGAWYTMETNIFIYNYIAQVEEYPTIKESHVNVTAVSDTDYDNIYDNSGFSISKITYADE